MPGNIKWPPFSNSLIIHKVISQLGFISFSVFGTSDKMLALVVDVLLQRQCYERVKLSPNNFCTVLTKNQRNPSDTGSLKTARIPTI